MGDSIVGDTIDLTNHAKISLNTIVESEL